MSICDQFVYIPHYGNGTASLNVAVAASIVFHHFAMWAKYAERERKGNKFVVTPVIPPSGPSTVEAHRVHEDRRLLAMEASGVDTAPVLPAMANDGDNAW